MRYELRCCTPSVYRHISIRLQVFPPVTALSSARAHDSAACRGATAGGGDAPNLDMLEARNRSKRVSEHTVPMAGIARNGTDSSAPMFAMA